MISIPYKLTTDKSTAVNPDVHWLDVKEFPPPACSKLLVINRAYGVAHLSQYRHEDGWTHWAPLPTFKKV